MATVKILPGESPYEIALVIVAALCLPISGMLRGLEAILSLAKLAKTEVQMAARAVALCAVVGPKEYFIGARVAHQVILGLKSRSLSGLLSDSNMSRRTSRGTKPNSWECFVTS